MQKLTLTQPDDWHLHLRDNEYLTRTVMDTSRIFNRAIVMPNLRPPVTQIKDALDYRERILTHIPKTANFQPLMTLYLTDNTTAELVKQAYDSPHIYAFKLYPAGATTNSDHGVTQLKNIYPALEAMEKYDVPLLVHGEIADPNIDIFDREKLFLTEHLKPIMQQFPDLRIVLEHVTTKEAVDFVIAAPNTLAATITAHHLILNRNDLLAGGIKPHNYCLPVVKREHHRQALINAAISGIPKFFLGTDSAPHSQNTKETACGCAGIYTGHAAIEIYAEVFEQYNALDKLEGFASFYGADFYKLPRNAHKINLIKQAWHVEEQLDFGKEKLVPFKAGNTVSWKLT